MVHNIKYTCTLVLPFSVFAYVILKIYAYTYSAYIYTSISWELLHEHSGILVDELRI